LTDVVTGKETAVLMVKIAPSETRGALS